MKIGIDPGIDGAIAIVGDKDVWLYDMPTIYCPWIKPKKNKAGKLVHPRMVDGKAISEILAPHIDNAALNIELVHSMPQQGVVSTFNFGQAYGGVVVLAMAMGFNPKFVRPQSWKDKIGATCQGKDFPRQLALNLYPKLHPLLHLVKHQGRADALFIALY